MFFWSWAPIDGQRGKPNTINPNLGVCVVFGMFGSGFVLSVLGFECLVLGNDRVARAFEFVRVFWSGCTSTTKPKTLNIPIGSVLAFDCLVLGFDCLCWVLNVW